MWRVAFIPMAFVLFCLALANDPNEVVRSREETYKQLQANKTQADLFHKIDDKYGAPLAKLRKERPSDYLIKRDAQNEKYTHDFMGAMSPVQKSTYRKYVRNLRQTYIKAHPDVDADNIFIWGGANLL